MTTSPSEPLAYLILDNAGRMIVFGMPSDEHRLQANVSAWNDPNSPYLGKPYRLVPVAEIPAESAAWQPIATAERDKEITIILGRPGCSAFGRWQGRYFRADSVDAVDKPDWTHWQPMPESPLPAPPKEKES